MIKPFRVIHTSGDERWAYEEDEKGFLHKVPLWPMIGLNGPPAYLLFKPAWKRVVKADEQAESSS